MSVTGCCERPGLKLIWVCPHPCISHSEAHIVHLLSSIIWHNVTPAPSLSGKVVPILVLQFENDPRFCGKTLTFQLKTTTFRHKTQTFQLKMNPLFCSKTLTFQTKWTSLFTVKHWILKLTPFSPNSWRWVPKYPRFLGKCESWISSKNTRLFANFRTRMRVVK